MNVGLDERTLRRIIALLVSFAVLAERAAGRSFPVRWLVLSILRYAEGVARDHVIDTAPWAGPYLEDAIEPGNSPMDAILLGQRLRMLAAVLSALLPLADHLDDWETGRVAMRQGLAPCVHRRPVRSGGWTPSPCDTS